MTTFRKINTSRKTAPCPRCGELGKRHSTAKRRPREVGITGPTRLDMSLSRHYCERCRKFFTQKVDHIVLPGHRCTVRAERTAVDLVVRQGLTLEKASCRMRRKYHVDAPPASIHGWVIAGIVLL